MRFPGCPVRHPGGAFFYPSTFFMYPYSIPTDQQLAEQTKLLIESDLSVYDPVHVLASKVGTNTFKLKLVFQQHYGETVSCFSRRVRISAAKKLLLETNYTLQTIGQLVGYSEGSNFQVSFKNVVGETPGRWRVKNGQM